MIVAVDEMHALRRQRMTVGESGDGLVVGSQDAADLAKDLTGILANFSICQPMDAERQLAVAGAIDPGAQPRHEIFTALPLDTPLQRLAAAVVSAGEMMHL